MRKIIPPDFIAIPFQVLSDKKLQPLDQKVYGFIYWFEHLKDGKCTAGNEVLAQLANCQVKGVQNGLTRLEKQGYIVRTYKDESKRIRKEIKTTISFKKVSLNEDTVSSNEGTQVSSNEDQKKKILKKKREGESTPKKSFKYLSQIPEEDLNEFEENYNASKSQVIGKAEDLKNYCESHGKRYKNYKSFLANALKKDFGKRTEEGRQRLELTRRIQKQKIIEGTQKRRVQNPETRKKSSDILNSFRERFKQKTQING